MRIFFPYIPYGEVKLIGVEAGGLGIASGKHAASLCAGRPGVLHGNRTYLLQDEHGQILETHSISAGPGYPRAGPHPPGGTTTRPAPHVPPAAPPRPPATAPPLPPPLYP